MRAIWKGTWAYDEALAAQRAHRDRLAAGEAEEELWLLEHPPTITTGRRSVADVDPARIAAAGYALHATERGGLATCHEPGQLVGYVLADVRALGAKRLVAALEEGVIGWLRAAGVPAGRREGYPGAWVGARKLCAVGLNVQGGFSMHGFALNLVNDRRGFGLIVPCGIVDGGVASVAEFWPACPSPADAAEQVGDAILASLLDARGPPVKCGGPEGT